MLSVPEPSGAAPPQDDPPPREPQKPLPSDCCESGCPVCVYDLYEEEMAHYRAELAKWRQRHPDAAA